MKKKNCFVKIFFIILFIFTAQRILANDFPTDLTTLSIEDLMNIEITSVSKKIQKVSDAAAAISVITQEDIQRSGANSIPELLRMVPGVDVARINANQWAVTIRGFNGRFANKLLVLIDGRSVYSPLFSGVFWDIQDTLLEDIERIEVIRGPGATLWGANAVNGVINIITKQAKDTQGGLLSAGGGTEERAFGAVRYGGKLGEDGHYRVYTKYSNRDSAHGAFGLSAHDQWDMQHGGFRYDGRFSSEDTLTVQGDLYQGTSGETLNVAAMNPPYSLMFNDHIEHQGGNILGRWRHLFSKTSEIVLQMYYDRTDREESINGEKRNTFDFDFQHQLHLAENHEIVWGLDYRLTWDHIENSFPVSILPNRRTHYLFSGFIQDEIGLYRDKVYLTLGSKFEYNNFTGMEVQPNIRFLWKPAPNHSFWGAASRAVHTPARADEDLQLPASVMPPFTPSNPGPLPLYVMIYGNPDLKSEELIALEMGYRSQVTSQLSFDIASFFNIYNHLRSNEPGTILFQAFPAPGHLVYPFTISNQIKGKTYGVEVATDWRPWEWWRIRPSYTFLEVQLDGSQSLDPEAKLDEGTSPHHQVYLSSSMDLRRDLEFDVMLRYIGKLPSLDVNCYTSMDARLAWKPHPNLEFDIVGQNLLSTQHVEFREAVTLSSFHTESERGVYGKILWRF